MQISAQSRQMNTLAPAMTRPLAVSLGIVLPQNEQAISFIDVPLSDNDPICLLIRHGTESSVQATDQ
jgi:hypothetical protein